MAAREFRAFEDENRNSLSVLANADTQNPTGCGVYSVIFSMCLEAEKEWWRELDLNQRSPKTSELQSDAFDRSAIPPLFTRPVLQQSAEKFSAHKKRLLHALVKSVM